MTGKKHNLLLAVLLAFFAGCNSPLSNNQLTFLIKESPLVPCNELSNEGGLTEWKGVPFSGRTIRYKWGFGLEFYQDGRQVPEQMIPVGATANFLPDEPSHHGMYRAAFREYATSSLNFTHDEYVLIIKYGYGDVQDVPKLIRGLEYYGDIKPDEPVVCSRDHCLEALKLVTGVNPGPNARDWRTWWTEHQPIPPYSILQYSSNLNIIVESKLKTEIIQDIEYRDSTIQDVVLLLCRRTKIYADREPDPDYDDSWRMPILSVPKDKLKTIPLVTIHGRNISLYDLIGQIAKLTGLEFVIDGGRPVLRYKNP